MCYCVISGSRPEHEQEPHGGLGRAVKGNMYNITVYTINIYIYIYIHTYIHCMMIRIMILLLLLLLLLLHSRFGKSVGVRVVSIQGCGEVRSIRY